MAAEAKDRKSTRLNSSHTEIYTLSLHDALPIWFLRHNFGSAAPLDGFPRLLTLVERIAAIGHGSRSQRSEEHTSELQSHRDLHSFPTRRSSDLVLAT